MEPTRCEARTPLTAAEICALESLPEPVGFELDLIAGCELQAAHRGVHMSLGQTDALGTNWWLTWPNGDRVFQQLTFCPVTRGTGVDEERCGLPLGHEGVHGFDNDGRCLRSSVHAGPGPPSGAGRVVRIVGRTMVRTDPPGSPERTVGPICTSGWAQSQ